MLTRVLYGVVLLLVLVTGQRAWTLHRAWVSLAPDTVLQGVGAPADKAKVIVDAFINYTHRPTRNINAAVIDAVTKNPDARLVIHVIPSGSLMALKTAQIAAAAGLQNKFMAMHEELIRNEKPLIDSNIRAMAERIKADPDRLMLDIKGQAVAGVIAREAGAEEILGTRQSPLFIINRKWLYGPPSEAAAPGDIAALVEKAGKD